MIFCITRQSAIHTARELVKLTTFLCDEDQKLLRSKYASQIKGKQLKEYFESGVGYHHAGVDAEDRQVLEEAFLCGCLPVMTCTSTLAMGLNLPAHLVIIKNTEQIIDGKFRGYNATQILQMIGRAGRPQFDFEGVAIIMTASDLKTHYQRLVNHSDVIESSLKSNLLERMNTEIALKMVTSLEDAVHWIENTYLYVRMRKAPEVYGLVGPITDEKLSEKVREMCLDTIRRLESLGLVVYDSILNSVEITDLGNLMMKHHLACTTIEMMWELQGGESLEDLIHFIACSAELKDMSLRNNEKTLLNMMNRARGRQAIRYPLVGRIATVPMKIACLLQCHLSHTTITDFSLQQDTNRIVCAATRIANGMTGMLLGKENRTADENFNQECSDPTHSEESTTVCETHEETDPTFPQTSGENSAHTRLMPVVSGYKAMINALKLRKSLQFGSWLNDPLEDLSVVFSITKAETEKLIDAGLITLRALQSTDPWTIEQILNRQPPFGRKLLDSIQCIPKYELTVEQVSSMASSIIRVQFTVKNETNSSSDTVVLLVGNTQNKLLASFKFKSCDLSGDGCIRHLTIVNCNDEERLSLSLISCNFAGVDIHTYFTVNRINDQNISAPVSPERPLQATDYSAENGQTPSTECKEGKKGEYADEDKALNFRGPPLLHNGDGGLKDGKQQHPFSPFDGIKRKRFSPGVKKMLNRFGIREKDVAHSVSTSLVSRSGLDKTFTWTPATPDSTPKVALVQTSMLEYIHSHSLKECSEERSKHLDNPANSASTGLCNDSTMMTPKLLESPKMATICTEPVRKKRRFKWTPSKSVMNYGSVVSSGTGSATSTPIRIVRSDDTNATVEATNSHFVSFDRDFSFLGENLRTPNQKDAILSATLSNMVNPSAQLTLNSNCSMLELCRDQAISAQSGDSESSSQCESVSEMYDATDRAVRVAPGNTDVTGENHGEYFEILARESEVMSAGETVYPQSPRDEIKNSSQGSHVGVLQTEKLAKENPLSPVYGTYTRGGAECSETILTPISMQQYHYQKSNIPRFSVRIRDPTPPSEATTTTPTAADSSEPAQDKFPPPTTSLTKNGPSTSDFKTPTDMGFNKLLNKWKRLERPRRQSVSPQISIDMKLLEEGWPELACTIFITKLCEAYGLEMDNTTRLSTPQVGNTRKSMEAETHSLEELRGESNEDKRNLQPIASSTVKMRSNTYEVDLDRYSAVEEKVEE
ncbi:unnamed protein product [Calicophoron daubneyi]|uniref:DNA 3'-5' helicase n=1 Tax=Calicophoron daubneyi TaxID=300641 RepID=A0AAV2TSM4_CALDB